MISDLDLFLTHFFPKDDELITLRALPAKGDKNERPQNYTTTRAKLKHGAALRDMRALNKTRGIYFAPNSGGHTDQSIVRFNALFVERDSGSLADQHKTLDAAPLAPDIRVDTLRSVHAYWLIRDPLCTSDAWTARQKQLVKFFDGDASIINPSRVMRLPFFDYLIFSPSNGGTYTRIPISTVSYKK